MLAIAPVQRVPARRVDSAALQQPFAALKVGLSDLRNLVSAQDTGPAFDRRPDVIPSPPPAQQVRPVREPTMAID